MRLPVGARFAVVSFACIIVIAITMGLAFSWLLTRAVTNWEWDNTATLVQREVEQAGLAALFVAEPTVQTQQRWSAELARLQARVPDAVRIKAWDRHSTVLWSDEPRLIGRQFRDNRELQEALSGRVSVEVRTPNGQEHVYERARFAAVAEVYVPIVRPGSPQVVGVVEVYKNPVRLLATIQQGRLVIWAISLAGALCLYLVLVPLVRQVYGREVAQATLRAHAERLQREVADRTRELEAQRDALYHAERMAAMGQLLAGVAHELNNPLATIVGYTELLQRKFGVGPLADIHDKIANAAERCSRIVKNFLALARQYPPERQLVSLNEILDGALELLAYPFKVDGVEVVRNLTEDLPALWADPHQLQQVVVNLLTNAHQALRLVESPRQVVLSTRYDAGRDRLVLEVADSGPGVPAEIQARIFEPFFTTKPPGQGTGLGLSLCRGIVEGHGGLLRVGNRPGQGAVFAVELPRNVPATRPDSALVDAEASTQQCTVLVVDDEPDVGDLLADLLRMDGHQVDTVSSGKTALDRLRTQDYEVIFSDIRMPGLDGPALYAALEHDRPELARRVIFVTGDTMNPATAQLLARTGALVLSKPFALDEVRRVLRSFAVPAAR
jgi:signal transduction histidine kinase/CheY-like chemotaxis protein